MLYFDRELTSVPRSKYINYNKLPDVLDMHWVPCVSSHTYLRFVGLSHLKLSAHIYSFIGILTCLPVYLLWMAACMLQCQTSVTVTETTWPTKPKIFTRWHFYRRSVDQPLSYGNEWENPHPLSLTEAISQFLKTYQPGNHLKTKISLFHLCRTFFSFSAIFCMIIYILETISPT